LKKAIPPLLTSESEAQLIAAVGAITSGTLAITFVIPLLLQIFIKEAMSRVWSIFNTLQIIILMPLMALSLPGNVQAIYDEI